MSDDRASTPKSWSISVGGEATIRSHMRYVLGVVGLRGN
jgi:hypothetical protein